MATRSRIGIQHEDGRVESIYSHWDGYPEHNGKILLEHYSDREKLQKLIDLGAISSLAPEVDAPEGHTFDTPANGRTVAYQRDRGDNFPKEYHRNASHFFGGDIEEFGYLLTNDGTWLVKSGNSKKGILPQKLTRILNGEEFLIR